MKLDLRRLFVFVCLMVAVVAIAVPAMAQYDKYTDVPPGTAPGDQVPSGSPAEPQGGLVFYTDRTAFETAFPGLTLEDWTGTSVPPGAITACPPPFNSSTNNACFTPGAIVAGLELDVIVAGGLGELVVVGTGALGNAAPLVGPNSFTDNSVMNLAAGNAAFGSVLNCPIAPAVLNIAIFDTGGAPLGNTTANCGAPPGNFWGVSSDVAIGSIEVTGGTGDAELYGETLFGAGPVPTMGSWGMLALILVLAAISGLVLYRRRTV